MKKHNISTTNHPGFKEMVHHGKQHPGFAAGAKKATAAPMPQPTGGMPSMTDGGGALPGAPAPMPGGGFGKC